MRAILFLLTLPLAGQDIFEQGAKVFRLSCAQGYCHGSGGTQGRAPKLIGRNFEASYIRTTVQKGIPNTGMPGFQDRLSADQVQAVTAYVVQISGGDTSKLGAATAAAAVREISGDARRGKELFFDPQRGVDRCGTCHALEGIGTAAGPSLVAGDYTVDLIRNGKPSIVRQATAKGGDKFPALVVETKGDRIQVFDLTAPPPVLRTFARNDVSFSGASAWRHSAAVRGYSAADLAAIAAYLKWIGER